MVNEIAIKTHCSFLFEITVKTNENRIFSKFYLLPFIAMFFDYLENGFIFQMVAHANDISSIIISPAGILTQLKGAFALLSWMIVLVMLGVWASYILLSRFTQDHERAVEIKKHSQI